MRILLIDDDPDDITLLGYLLDPYAEVTAVRDQDEICLVLYGMKRPDVILVDARMAPLSGAEVCGILATCESADNIPIAMMSGIVVPGHNYIEKPHDIEDTKRFMNQVENVINESNRLRSA